MQYSPAVWFLLGLGWEAILTLDVLFTANEIVWAAGLTSFVLSVLSFTVYSKIVHTEKSVRHSLVVAISAGSACGAMLSIMIFK